MKLERWERPSLTLLIKLGSIVVHADELTSKGGHPFDLSVLRALIDDPEVAEWIKKGGVYLPLKRGAT